MSYQQEVKWEKKHRKGTHQHVIMSTGSGPWPSIYANPLMDALLSIGRWFPDRNTGDQETRAHTRACIREQIDRARKIIRESKQR